MLCWLTLYEIGTKKILLDSYFLVNCVARYECIKAGESAAHFHASQTNKRLRDLYMEKRNNYNSALFVLYQIVLLLLFSSY